MRAAAGWVLERTLQSLAPGRNRSSTAALARFDERDQGLLRELVMGSLRWLRRLDHVIAAGEQPALRPDRDGAPLAAAHRRLPAPVPRPGARARRGPRGRGAGAPAHPPRRRELRQRRAAPHRARRRAWRAGRSRSPIRCGGWRSRRAIPTSSSARWLERFGRERTLRAAGRQQPAQADAAPRLPRPRRARAAGRGADRRGAGGGARGALAARASPCAAAIPLATAAFPAATSTSRTRRARPPR